MFVIMMRSFGACYSLAENVVKQTEIRNASQEATRIVELKK